MGVCTHLHPQRLSRHPSSLHFPLAYTSPRGHVASRWRHQTFKQSSLDCDPSLRRSSALRLAPLSRSKTTSATSTGCPPPPPPRVAVPPPPAAVLSPFLVPTILNASHLYMLGLGLRLGLGLGLGFGLGLGLAPHIFTCLIYLSVGVRQRSNDGSAGEHKSQSRFATTAQTGLTHLTTD